MCQSGVLLPGRSQNRSWEPTRLDAIKAAWKTASGISQRLTGTSVSRSCFLNKSERPREGARPTVRVGCTSSFLLICHSCHKTTNKIGWDERNSVPPPVDTLTLTGDGKILPNTKKMCLQICCKLLRRVQFPDQVLKTDDVLRYALLTTDVVNVAFFGARSRPSLSASVKQLVEIWYDFPADNNQRGNSVVKKKSLR